jgi:hypothetical protein
MNLDSIVSLGTRPWLPSSDATGLDIWHEDDVPVVGTFDLGDVHVLFSIVGSAESTLTTWGYVVLEAAEFESLSEKVYDTPVELDEDVKAHFANRRLVFAIANHYVIEAWGPTEEASVGLLAGATTFLNDYVAVVKGQTEGLKREADVLKRRLDALRTRTSRKLISNGGDVNAGDVTVAFIDRPMYVRPTLPQNEQDRILAFEETQAQVEHLV